MDIRFDKGPSGSGDWFQAPQSVLMAEAPGEVEAVFAAAERARAEGKWLAGYASYELGYALEPKLAPLMPEHRRLPLVAFGVYDAPATLPTAVDWPSAGGVLTGFQSGWSEAEYRERFEAVHAYIGAGDIYQANLTFPITCRYAGSPEAIYGALSARQPVRHGAYVAQSGLPDILSRSPELFFRVSADGLLETRPMKGTMPRGETPGEDAAHIAFLQADEKNRAENLMIVDLLRNDISRVSELGSVRVPQLYEVETYATVHQMVSHITSQMRRDVGLYELFAALFPCGSITGAPKVRAMEIIRELETGPREIYCGSIGWIAPDGRMEFNVGIRTLLLEKGQGLLNVGGGVVWDSTGDAEYEEALWKSRFARITPPVFG